MYSLLRFQKCLCVHMLTWFTNQIIKADMKLCGELFIRSYGPVLLWSELASLPKIMNLRKKRVHLITFPLSLPYPCTHHIAFLKVCPAPHQQKKGSLPIISSTLTSLVSSQMCPDRSQKLAQLFILQKI